MELKAKLNNPYTIDERVKFITKNHVSLGYDIKETVTALEAWGYTDTEALANAKEIKYNEANTGAKNYLESGGALFEFEEGKHIEATDGNIAKLTAYALAFVTGQLQPTDTVVWNTKEDVTVELSSEQVAQIIAGLGSVQAQVWAVKFPSYTSQIDAAQTIEEVERIIIDYDQCNI